MRPNQKVEENKPASELDFTLKYKWPGHYFDVEYLTEPYCGLLPTIAINTNESSSTQLKQPMQLIAAAEQAYVSIFRCDSPLSVGESVHWPS